MYLWPFEDALLGFVLYSLWPAAQPMNFTGRSLKEAELELQRSESDASS